MKQPFKLMPLTTPAIKDPEPTTIRAGIWQLRRLKTLLSTCLKFIGIFGSRLG